MKEVSVFSSTLILNYAFKTVIRTCKSCYCVNLVYFIHQLNCFQLQSVYFCVFVGVTLYGRYRGRAAWQWCLPAPALLNRWHIPQSLWTGCPLRKTIGTEANWERSCPAHLIIYQMFSSFTESCITICLTFGTQIPVAIRAQTSSSTECKVGNRLYLFGTHYSLYKSAIMFNNGEKIQQLIR